MESVNDSEISVCDPDAIKARADNEIDMGVRYDGGMDRCVLRYVW